MLTKKYLNLWPKHDFFRICKMFTSTKTHELGKLKIKGKMCSLAKKKEERVLSEEISERLGEVQVVIV